MNVLDQANWTLICRIRSIIILSISGVIAAWLCLPAQVTSTELTDVEVAATGDAFSTSHAGDLRPDAALGETRNTVPETGIVTDADMEVEEQATAAAGTPPIGSAQAGTSIEGFTLTQLMPADQMIPDQQLNGEPAVGDGVGGSVGNGQ